MPGIERPIRSPSVCEHQGTTRTSCGKPVRRADASHSSEEPEAGRVNPKRKRSRRAGRKKQLRRLVASLYRTPPSNNDHCLGVEPLPADDYDNLFRAHPVVTKVTPRPYITLCRAYRLTPIEDLYPDLPLSSLPRNPRDPRPDFYARKRAELLHVFYGASTPPHLAKPERGTTGITKSSPEIIQLD